MTDHPITPPPELVQQWVGDYYGCPVSGELAGVETAIATRAAQWGADQELEACCALLVRQGFDFVDDLRAARRPKPPSLKRVALLQLDTLNADLGLEGKGVDLSQIRRALEALPD
jgi:hypothetical protein